jgi:hypothetical protein
LYLPESSKIFCSTDPAVPVSIIVEQTVQSRGKLVLVKMTIA